MNRKIIIDTDPGQDDALALLLALSAPDCLEVCGVTTVAGNVPVDQTCINALRICQLAGRPEVPVFKGCPRPILRPLHTAEFICGADGLAGMALEAPRQGQQQAHAVAFLIDTLRHSDRPITLCALGPLTNIALALVQAPDISDKIEQCIIMGGARDLGNMTAAAEFNFFVDPHAASIVFASGVPIVLFPLNATYQAVATPARLAGFDRQASVSRQIVSMLRRERPGGAALGGDDGHPMHDACVIAYLLWPELFEGRDCNVEIEIAEGTTVGRSTIDWWGRSSAKPNAHVVATLNADAMFERMAGAVRALDQNGGKPGDMN
ncbi:MAG: nucleoside hydrolase [Rhizobiaceae bacterium]|nr:nucleoside hydrolase [Rhizobiaceae bacterium]